MVRNKARRANSNWSRASLSFPCTMKICLAYPLIRMVGHSEVAHQKLAGRINLSLDILKLALMGHAPDPLGHEFGGRSTRFACRHSVMFSIFVPDPCAQQPSAMQWFSRHDISRKYFHMKHYLFRVGTALSYPRGHYQSSAHNFALTCLVLRPAMISTGITAPHFRSNPAPSSR
jgi:hypothetical protein